MLCFALTYKAFAYFSFRFQQGDAYMVCITTQRVPVFFSRYLSRTHQIFAQFLLLNFNHSVALGCPLLTNATLLILPTSL